LAEKLIIKYQSWTIASSLMACFSYYIWQGKDVLLLAVGALCTSCHKAILAEGSSSSIAILNLVSSACTRKGKKYREAALSSLEQVSNLFIVGAGY